MNFLIALFLLVGQIPRGMPPYPSVTGPSLSCTHSESTTNASLTTNGTTDWIMFNSSTTPDRKSGGGSVLSSYTKVGTAFTEVVGDTSHETSRALTWTDGTPNASGSTNQGIFNARTATNQGFSFTCPADTSSHRCIGYMSSYIGPSQVTVHLSDSSAADFVYTAPFTGGAGAETFNCQYKAASGAQTVTFTWITTAALGSPGVSINGAAFQ